MYKLQLNTANIIYYLNSRVYIFFYLYNILEIAKPQKQQES